MEAVSGPRGFQYTFTKLYAVARKPARIAPTALTPATAARQAGVSAGGLSTERRRQAAAHLLHGADLDGLGVDDEPGQPVDLRARVPREH
jgi:hypothetical protein